MTGRGGGLSCLGTALVIFFAITLLVVFAQLFYVFWRRCVFRHQTNTVGGGEDQASPNSSSQSTLSSISSSKELLYFLCTRSQFGLDSNSFTDNSGSGANDHNSNEESNVEVVDLDLVRTQGIFGPPRFLFTINEEEREDHESSSRKTLSHHDEIEVRRNVGDENGGTMTLEEYLQSALSVDIDDRGGLDDVTSFSTPSDSPVYLTPPASPLYEVVNGRSPDEGLITSTTIVV